MKSNVKNKLHGPVHQPDLPKKHCRRMRISWHPRGEQWATSQDRLERRCQSPRKTRRAQSHPVNLYEKVQSREKRKPISAPKSREPNSAPGSEDAPRRAGPFRRASKARELFRGSPHPQVPLPVITEPKQKPSCVARNHRTGQLGRDHRAASGPNPLRKRAHPGAQGTGPHPDGSGISSPRETPRSLRAVRCPPSFLLSGMRGTAGRSSLPPHVPLPRMMQPAATGMRRPPPNPALRSPPHPRDPDAAQDTAAVGMVTVMRMWRIRKMMLMRRRRMMKVRRMRGV